MTASFNFRFMVAALLASGISPGALSQEQHVSQRISVLAPSHTFSANAGFVPPSPEAQPQPAGPLANNWQLLATLPGAIIHDIAFPSATTGYAVAEAGQVWKTIDGGKTWNLALNLGYPYYFYGVAVRGKNVYVTGFYDAQSQEGVLRISHDSGKTWGNDIVLSQSWLQRVRFSNAKDGLIIQFPGSTTMADYTTNAGANWSSAVADQTGGWFGFQFSFLGNQHARTSGIHFCTSLNGGAAWSCGPSVDSVFDGPVFFLNDRLGWVGGGEISPNVEGWVHVTTNGGKTWSGRTLDGPWPIREIMFVDAKRGWAAGGNFYTGVGGIYFSSDGGQTWSVDVTTGKEMGSCDKHALKPGYQVWCAGYDSSLNGYIYSTQIQ